MTAARFPDGTERRAAVELRAAGRVLTGHAAVFASPTRIGPFTEVIRAGAFTATLAAGKDVVALVDHDPSRLLARTGSGSLRLSEDARGLAFELDVPNTTLGNDIIALAERRDLGGASFSFRATEEHWSDRNHRELRSVELLEISIIHAYPAYAATEVSVRCRPADPAAFGRIRRMMIEVL